MANECELRRDRLDAGILHAYCLGPTLADSFGIRSVAGLFCEVRMHYPHRISRIKRKRAIGFRARMKTTNGRKLINRKRAVGRSLNVADKKRG